MKKFLISIFVVALSALCLFSCSSDVTIYSKADNVKSSVIIADFAEDVEKEAYNSICSALERAVGKDGFFNKTDIYLEAPREIIIGKTNRTATAKALELLNSSYTEDGDTGAYVIYAYNGSIAIVANNDFALPIAIEYFIENYLTGESLSVNANLADLKVFSISAYKAQRDEELTAISDAAFEKRWDEALATIGPEATAALQRLYAFYGTEWATWMINLYDSEAGCFYYSNSARDYDGFYVDVESTCQALDQFLHAGLFEEFNNKWAEALPADMRAKCLAYVQAMQDPADGYFYHPQWGKEIDDSRRGRDLSQALTLITRMGGTPLYETALDKIGETADPVSSVISSFMDTDAHKSTVEAVVDDKFQSEENMLKYLESLKINKNSYDFGHKLSSETEQIVAAGLGEFVCDYIDEHQNPETGLWENIDLDNLAANPSAAYQAASGVVKISSFYSSVNGAIKHGDKMLDTLIDILLIDSPTTQITFVFNPWGALSSAVSSIKHANKVAAENGQPPIYNEASIYQKIYTKLPDLITKTIEKLTPYKHEDGSFSYLENGNSLANSQGVIASLGYNEGDINGTACAMHYILNALFGCLNISRVPMLKYSDYISFRDTVETTGAVVKQPVPANECLDFEDYDGTDLPTRLVLSSVDSAGESVEVIDFEQLNGDDGKVLAINSIASNHNSVVIEAKSSNQKMQCFTLSFDLYVDSADTGPIYQIFFRNTNNNNWYAYMVEITAGGGVVSIRDNTTDSYTDAKYMNDLEITEKTDTWFNLKFEYYVIEDEETGTTTAKIKVYKNGVCVKISDNYFVNNISTNQPYFSKDNNGQIPKPAPLTYVNQLVFFARTGPASKILLDNIDCITSTAASFSDADVVPGAGIMVESDTVVNDIIDFEDGAADPTIFTGTEDFFTVENKATTDNADNMAYKLTSIANQRVAKIGIESTLIKKSVFTFEADICIDDVEAVASDNGAYLMLFSDIDLNAFILSLDVLDGKVKLATWNSTANATPVVELGVSADVGDWFKLKVEYYPVSATEAHIVVYINGNYVGESDTYYDKATGKSVVEKINSITIYDRTATKASLYIDNIKCSYDATKTYVPQTPDTDE